MNIKLGNIIVVLCVLALCFGEPANPVKAVGELAITGVNPQTVYNDLDTTITVKGDGFTEVIRVALDDTDLPDFQILDAQTLTAVIPWGMAPATYALNVFTATDSTSMASAVTIELGIGEWISEGPYGGNVSQILQNPNNNDIIFAVVTGVGVFRSADHGENWEFIFATDMGTLAMDAVNPSLLYVTKTLEGLYRSLDGGESWQAVPFPGISQINIARAYPHPTQENTVFAGLYFSDSDYDDGINFGIYKSTNAGGTWTHVSNGIPNEKKITALSFGTDYMYAGTDEGLIYRGNADGTSWEALPIDWSGESVIHVGKLSVQPVTGDLFVITSGDGYTGQMFRCVEVDTLGEISLDCEAVMVGDDSIFSSTDAVGDVQFNPDNQEDILIAFSKPARSTDNGLNWNIYTDYSAPLQSVAVMFDYSLPNTIFSSNAQGLFRNSTANIYDSGWEKTVDDMTGIIPNYMAVSASEPQSIYANPNGAGLFHSSDGGINWEQLPNFSEDGKSQYTLNTPVAVDGSDDDVVIVGTFQNSVKISLDGGMIWTESSKIPIPAEYPGYTFAFRFLEPVPNTSHVFLAGGYLTDPETHDDNQAPAGAIYRLALEGTTATWTELLVEPVLGRIQGVVFDPADPTQIYCASYTKGGDGYALHAALVYSLDSGDHWLILTPPSSAFDIYTEMRTLAISPSTGTLLVDGGNDILSIDPTTNTWQVYSHIPANSGPFNHLLFAPALGATPETLYAATMEGFFQSIDGGQTWSYVSPKFIGVNVTALKYVALNETQGIVYTGIVGGLMEAMGGETAGRTTTHRSSDDLVDGGVYHLTRQYAEEILNYLPLIRK